MQYKDSFVTDNNTILIVTVKINDYISITGDEIAPIAEEQAIELNNYLLEDLLDEVPEEEVEDYKWRYEDTTELFDNSLYIDEFNYNGKTYLYDSIACGCLHNQTKQVTDKFNFIIKHHLDRLPAYKQLCKAKLKQLKQPEDLDIKIYNQAIDIIS